jgi:alanyl-tRNA synthetase
MVTMAEGESLELCGGTHVNSTGDIGFFQITGQEAVAAGVRRIHALVGKAAIDYYQKQKHLLEDSCQILQTPYEQLPDQIKSLKIESQVLKDSYEKALLELVQHHLKDAPTQLLKDTSISIKVCSLSKDFLPLLKKSADYAKGFSQTLTVLLCYEPKKSVVLGVLSDDLKKEISLKEGFSFLGEKYSLKGGGKPGFFQAGGSLRKEDYEHLCHQMNSFIEAALNK